MRGLKIFMLLALLFLVGCGDPPAVLDTTDDKTTRVTFDAMLQVMTPEEANELGEAVKKILMKEHSKEKFEEWNGLPTAEMMKPLEGLTADGIISKANSL